MSGMLRVSIPDIVFVTRGVYMKFIGFYFSYVKIHKPFRSNFHRNHAIMIKIIKQNMYQQQIKLVENGFCD